MAGSIEASSPTRSMRAGRRHSIDHLDRIMKMSDTDTISGSGGDAPSRTRRATVISPRAEAFKTGRRTKGTDSPENPFDPRKYREIYSETD